MANTKIVLLILGISSTQSVFANECQLLPDSGSCTTTGNNTGKFESRYYYSSANFKCTEFPYSGCGGNENNYNSVEECKRKCQKPLSDVPVIASILSAQTQGKCFYGNKTYAVKESIPEATIDSPCSLSCFCGSYRPGQGPSITCAAVDCPPYPEERDCVPVNKEGECCSDFYCPSTASEEANKPFECTYQGKTYVEGQSIEPDDYPCIACTCSKNWKGVLTTEGGVCKEVNCGITIHNQQKLVKGCTPKFYTTSAGKQSCCPIEWNCLANKKKDEGAE